MGARANVYVGGDCHKGARRLQRIIRETGEKSKYKENLCGYTGRVCVTNYAVVVGRVDASFRQASMSEIV